MPKSARPLWKILLPVVAIVAMATGALLIVRSQVGAPHPGHVEVVEGTVLPDFEMTAFDPASQGGGAKVTLSGTGARVLMLNFWATWCEACMVEMPSIQQLRDSYKDRGFEVAAINVDEKPEAEVPRAQKLLGLTIPVYLDPEQKLADLLDIHAIPLTVVIDSGRKILFVERGERDWNSPEIREMMERWLGQ
jgi:thiol-disulfide isomerase/thioredoxin